MNPLLPLKNQHSMSSREIAALTGSAHDSVLKTVRSLIERGIVSGDETPYTHPQNRQTYTEFQLDYRNTMVVVSGYSPELRARIIDRWQELEAQAIPKTLPEALRLAADLAEQNQQQAALLEQQRPAVEFLDRYVEAKSTKSLREVAKVLGVKEREFIAGLEADGILFRQGGFLLPSATYQHKGYFEVKTGESNGHAYHQTRFTPAGLSWIAGRLA